jgi:hypothetical protein
MLAHFDHQAVRLASLVLLFEVSSVRDMWWCMWRVDVNSSRYVRCMANAACKRMGSCLEGFARR